MKNAKWFAVAISSKVPPNSYELIKQWIERYPAFGIYRVEPVKGTEGTGYLRLFVYMEDTDRTISFLMNGPQLGAASSRRPYGTESVWKGEEIYEISEEEVFRNVRDVQDYAEIEKLLSGRRFLTTLKRNRVIEFIRKKDIKVAIIQTACILGIVRDSVTGIWDLEIEFGCFSGVISKERLTEVLTPYFVSYSGKLSRGLSLMDIHMINAPKREVRVFSFYNETSGDNSYVNVEQMEIYENALTNLIVDMVMDKGDYEEKRWQKSKKKKNENENEEQPDNYRLDHTRYTMGAVENNDQEPR